MDYGLVVIGAHDGSKLEKEIVQIAKLGGPVLLVEPVPALQVRLKARYARFANVRTAQVAVSDKTGSVDFHHIPNPEAVDLPAWASELGSLTRGHAEAHLSDAATAITTIKVDCLSLDDLFNQFEVTGIKEMAIDTEGNDYIILRNFPFSRVRPRNLLFEHKHMDGPGIVGRRYAETLLRLSGFGYQCRVVDSENTVARSNSS